MNIALTLKEWAKKNPYKKAVIFPQGLSKEGSGKTLYEHITYKELDERSDLLALRLSHLGMKKGHKALLFLKPSLDFPVVVFALFKMGVIPVLIDPGMGLNNLRKTIKLVAPDAFFSVPKGHILKRIFPTSFSSLRFTFITKRMRLVFSKELCLRTLIGDYSNAQELQFIKDELHFETLDCDPQEMAAILYTSGGTGIPKGVVYTHEIFFKQSEMLKSLFSLTEDDVDLPGFPFFCLFSLTMGMTVCLPDMDPTKPARAPSEKLVKNILDQGVTFAAGSPAIWERVGTYCLQNNILLPSIKKLAMFGAPVRLELHQMFSSLLDPNVGDTYTPYGATECLPISLVKGSTILKKAYHRMRDGKGYLVGAACEGIQIKIIENSKEVYKELPPYEIGEIIVSGQVVTKEYYQMPDKTALAKIQGQDGFWHRMGDLGYLDEENNLWFCGRKDHYVESAKGKWYSVQVESIFNQHPKVKRSALIGLQGGLGDKAIPSLVIERIDKKKYLSFEEKTLFERELLEIASRYSHTKEIKQFFYMKSLPVDIRHNIKIDRLRLRDQFLGTKGKGISK